MTPVDLHILPLPPCGRSSRRQDEQHTCAALARIVAGDTAVICHRPDGSPFIPGFGRHISISHCSRLAVMAVADTPHIGVDAEIWRDQLLRVAPRFLSPRELPIWTASEQSLLRAWTVKEAVYKAALTPGLPLHHILLPHSTDATVAATADGRRWILDTSIHGHVLVTSAVINNI